MSYFHKNWTTSGKVYCLWRSIYKEGEGWVPSTGSTPPHFCSCPKPGSPTSYIVIPILCQFIMVVLIFDWIVDYHCLYSTDNVIYIHIMKIQFKYNIQYFDMKTEGKRAIIFNTQYTFYIKEKYLNQKKLYTKFSILL